jgi:predicted short-subunit dehydrogenase-like oxidoreductase (DUF2520 family)
MTKNTQVSFIGSGNLAWHLAPALDNADFPVLEVYSKNPSHAALLVERLYEADVKASLDFSTSSSSVFIIAVSDDAVEEVVQEIILPEDAILLHTSGSQPLTILGYAATQNLGVLYPLQTFSKDKKVDFKDIPVFIESTNETTDRVLRAITNALSNSVIPLNSFERRALHVAAIFASNFTNHMLLVAQDIMKEHSLVYDWLKPLIAEMINKSLNIGPENAQTGPARRGDLEVLDKHLEFLHDNPPAAELYKVISQHIIDRYG